MKCQKPMGGGKWASAGGEGPVGEGPVGEGSVGEG